MKPQNVQDKITLLKLNSKFASELKLVFRSNSEDTSVLNVGLIFRVFESIRLLPHATKLVAYHTEDRVAVGFITLEKNSAALFSIKDVFVDPRYRRMGIASHLLDRAIKLAKEKGAKKLNLIVDPSKNNVIKLYSEYGFEEIGYARLIQGFFSAYSPVKALKRTVLGQRIPQKATNDQKNRLIKLSVSSQNRAKLFDIFQNNMSKDWLDFFEITSENFNRGSRHVWHPNFFKDTLITGSGDSFALIFHQPYPPKDTIELYRGNVPMVPLLEDLLEVLPSRGTGLTQIWLFGKTDDVPADWLKDRALLTFSFLGMGKTL